MMSDQSPIAFYAASSADPDRAGHLRITVELFSGEEEEATTLDGFVRAEDVPAALRGMDGLWKGAGVEAVRTAVFSALHSEAAFSALHANGTAHTILAGALWVACRNANIGVNVEKGLREALQTEGQARIFVSYAGGAKAAPGQLRVELVPVNLPH
jgi:hypothetical protein